MNAETLELTAAAWRRFNPLGEKAGLPVLVLLLMAAGVLISANFNQPFYKFDDATHLKCATENSIAELFDIDRKETLLPISFLSLRIERALFGASIQRDIVCSGREFCRADFGRILERTRGWATGDAGDQRAVSCLGGVGAVVVFEADWGVGRRGTDGGAGVDGASDGVRIGVLDFGAEERSGGAVWVWGAGGLGGVCAEHGGAGAAVSGLYLLAVLSKPTAVGFLPIFAALEMINPGGAAFDFREPKRWIRLLLCMAGPVVITAAVIAANMHIHAIFFVEHPGGSTWTALLTDLTIFARYMGNVLFPADLSFFYGVRPIVSLGEPRAWLYGALILGGCAVMVWAPADPAARKRAVLGVIWFFAALGPTSNLAPIPFWMQDRYAYVSAAGLLLAAVEAGRGVVIRLRGERFAAVVGAGFVALLAVMALLRSPVYVNAEALFLDAAARQPLSGMAQSCMFNSHLINAKRARTVEARREECGLMLYYLKRAEQCPDLTNFRDEFEMHLNAAHALVTIGEFETALVTLKEWVPPPAHLKPSPPAGGHVFVATDLKRYYNPERMAFAHTLVADALLTLVERKPSLPAAERLKRIDEAARMLEPGPEVIGGDVAFKNFDWVGTRGKLRERVERMRAGK